MSPDTTQNPSPRRLLPWSNPEFHQAVIRLFIVACAIAFSFSDYWMRHSPSDWNVRVGQWVSLSAGLATLLIIAWTLGSPEPSTLRRLIGITHDTLTISIAMYLGVDANAVFGVVYLVVIIGNGLRFGAAYMGYATVCSLLGFGAVHHFSPYWQSSPTLSFYIAAVLLVVPACLYGLLRSLHRARAELEQRANHDYLTGLINRASIEQRIREQVHRFRLPWGGRVYSVGTSIGVAASDSVQDGQSLLRLADAACYAAKNAGRNSVHVVGLHQRITDTGLLRGLSAGD